MMLNNSKDITAMLKKMESETIMRAEWLDKHDAPNDWLILTKAELTYMHNVIAKCTQKMSNAGLSPLTSQFGSN